MMSLTQFLLTCVISLTLFSCHTSSNSNDAPKAKQKRTSGVCEAESNLMALGIVNGELVKKGDPDDKTAVMLIGSNQTLCTAAPITDEILITAAHCVPDDSTKYVAAFYPSLSCESGFDITKYAVGVRRIARHSGYDMTVPVENRTDDIALIFLSSKIPVGYPIYKIADPQLISESSPLYLYGYGVTGENKGGRGILRKTTVDANKFKIVSDERKVRVEQHNSNGFCMGDSGGPGIVAINSELQILGINSYVNGLKGEICNNLGYQTLVKPYQEWIEFQKSGYN